MADTLREKIKEVLVNVIEGNFPKGDDGRGVASVMAGVSVYELEQLFNQELEKAYEAGANDARRQYDPSWIEDPIARRILNGETELKGGIKFTLPNKGICPEPLVITGDEDYTINELKGGSDECE